MSLLVPKENIGEEGGLRVWARATHADACLQAQAQSAT